MFLLVIQVAMVEAFHGVHVDMNRVVLPPIGAPMLVLALVMGRLQPNWSTGIRTPWTLSSARSWRSTHRVGGRVFLALGLVWIAAAGRARADPRP